MVTELVWTPSSTLMQQGKFNETELCSIPPTSAPLPIIRDPSLHGPFFWHSAATVSERYEDQIDGVLVDRLAGVLASLVPSQRSVVGNMLVDVARRVFPLVLRILAAGMFLRALGPLGPLGALGAFARGWGRCCCGFGRVPDRQPPNTGLAVQADFDFVVA